MKFVSLFIPGRFEDAHLYMGHLVILTEARTIRVCNLEDVVGAIEARIGSGHPIPTLMFLRNDWLVSEQFKKLTEGPELSAALLSYLDSFPRPFVELREGVLPIREYDLRIPAQVLLDSTIYNGRLYVGANSGLYDLDLHWKPDDEFISNRDQRKRLDARCIAISAKYGAVNASCGDEGLFTAIDDFGWTTGRGRQDLQKIDEKSIKTGWMTYDVVNYRTFSTPFLLRSSHEKRSSANVERERTVLTNIGNERVNLESLLDHVREEYNVEQHAIRYTFNSNNVVFVQTVTGDFYSIGVSRERDGDPRVTFTKTYKGVGNRILSASPTRVGLVVETESRVLLFSKGAWITIVDSEVLAVRTFTRSRRYQNLVAITKEDGLLLIGFFDETTLPRKSDRR